jgi:hypothetical protein
MEEAEVEVVRDFSLEAAAEAVRIFPDYIFSTKLLTY